MSGTTADPLTPALRKRMINAAIRESLDALPPTEAIGFFCECSSRDCFETVWLTRDEYDAGRSNPKWSVQSKQHRR